MAAKQIKPKKISQVTPKSIEGAITLANQVKSDIDAVKTFQKSIDEMSKIFDRYSIIGTLIIAGTALSGFLTILAALFQKIEVGEVIALSALSAVMIVSGCVLYAFFQNLNYKHFVASQQLLNINAELINNAQERKTRIVESLLGTVSEYMDDENYQIQSPSSEGAPDYTGGAMPKS